MGVPGRCGLTIHTNPHVTATAYAHVLPRTNDLNAQVWEDFQKTARTRNSRASAGQPGLLTEHPAASILFEPLFRHTLDFEPECSHIKLAKPITR